MFAVLEHADDDTRRDLLLINERADVLLTAGRLGHEPFPVIPRHKYV